MGDLGGAGMGASGVSFDKFFSMRSELVIGIPFR